MSERWSAPVTTSTAFSSEQAQRVQALRAAREVIEVRGPSSAFASGGTEINLPYLIETAQWVIDGNNPQIAQRVVERMYDDE